MQTELNQKADSTGNPKKGVWDGRVFEIQKLDERTGMPQYYITDNVNAANTISTNHVRATGRAGLNLTGTGITIGEWDAPIVDVSQYPVVATELGTRLTQLLRGTLNSITLFN